MQDNQLRDPEVNLKSILGTDEMVLNLRPTDKSKHIAKSFFALSGHTKAQRMQDENLLYRNKHLNNRDLGLPAINERIEKMNKKFEKQYNRRNSTI